MPGVSEASIEQMDRYSQEAEVTGRLALFLRRNYESDANGLNETLSRPGKSAGFAATMPPIPYTGNPFALTTGNCIALFGLNPRWRSWSDPWAQLEYKPYRALINGLHDGTEGSLDKILRFRAAYFDEGCEYYYGKYFTRLGKYIGENFLNQTCTETPNIFARRAFRNHIFKSDLLPWFSENTSAIDWARVASSSEAALDNYYSLTHSLLALLRPRWIQINGTQSLEHACRQFNADVKEFKTAGDRRIRYYIGAAHLPWGTAPILIHPFLSWSLGTNDAIAIAQTFQSMQQRELFSFV